MLALVTCTLFAAFQQKPAEEYCNFHNLPIHGTLRGQEIVGSFGDRNSWTAIVATSTFNPKNTRVLDLTSNQCVAHCRHHNLGEKRWFFFGPERVDWAHLSGAPRTGSSGLPALRKKYERERGRQFGGFGGIDPAIGVAIDFVPVSDKAVRQFYFVMKTKKIESWETEFAFEQWKNATGGKVSGWKVAADERNPETIDSAFVEDFYVFQRSADYYFVTQSGELYVAPPAKKGEKSRTMTALWDDKTRPIVGIIEDADHDKIWLFAESKKANPKRGYYFEMKSATQFATFEPAKLRPVNAGGRAKTLLEYLPLIQADSKK